MPFVTNMGQEAFVEPTVALLLVSLTTSWCSNQSCGWQNLVCVLMYACSLVRFCTPVTALGGYWDPYPIDMEFRPPCMVRSTIGISKPGKLEGNSTSDCSKHLYQLHVCVPSSRGKTRLLYRLSLDFLPILKHVPYIEHLWRYLANKVSITE